MIQRLLFMGLLAAGAAALSGQGVLRGLPREEFRAAGLEKLTPEELAILEAIFEAHSKGRLQAVREESAKQVAAAEEKARQAEAKHAAEPAPEKAKGPGWLKALVTLEKTGSSPDMAEVFETRLKGLFKGWSGRTVFTLENGQRWQQANPGEYAPARDEDAPRVKIYPGSLGTYWLEVEGHRQRVRVKPISL
jgi:hypothetical protein